ncbi:MAG TPA: hypothetical protein VFK68_13560 [Propionibacteriaceae bacterium]|nr:hypothetical protein [Propionibacteriaceae bacterium]
MLSAIVAMTVILAIIVGLALVVTVGIAGLGGRYSGTRFAALMRRTAQHLNGEAEPPQALLRLLEARH